MNPTKNADRIVTQTTIGMDLGDRFSALYELSADGEGRSLPPVRMNKESLRAALVGVARPVHVIVEAGTHSRWVTAELEALGHIVTVANPRQVKLIAQGRRKNDQKDAELLARLGRADVKLLSPIKHRGIDAQRDLAALKARDVLVGTRTKLVNFMRGLVKSFGERLPDCDARVFAKRAREACPAGLKGVLEPVLDSLDAIEESIRESDARIEAIADKDSDVQLVSQPYGVGTLTALTFLRVLEDKKRVSKSRDVAPILGLTPRQDQSGSIDRQLGITKAGDSLCRKLLVQAAQVLLMRNAPDSDLKRWGLALAERGGKSGKKRTTIAVARKLAVLMHRLWVTGEEYQPLNYRLKTAV